MSRQIVLCPPSVNRRQPLLTSQSSTGSVRFAEVAGGTTAECAAVCCCCPCGLVNLLVLAVYKLPAGLCRRALRKKRRQRLMKKGLLQQRRRCSCGCEEIELQIHPVLAQPVPENKPAKWDESEKEVMELEKEMWDRFYSTGFWRSPSQRSNA
ncbi:hypothetical protein L1049_007889 [Liquidambar formosana]|uniref:Uncharacterized protein n=1 Tax=Liquidambar formosana TaxID=63359 RepID=A0AAP0S8U5_LIQFO